MSVVLNVSSAFIINIFKLIFVQVIYISPKNRTARDLLHKTNIFENQSKNNLFFLFFQSMWCNVKMHRNDQKTRAYTCKLKF